MQQRGRFRGESHLFRSGSQEISLSSVQDLARVVPESPG